MVNIYHHLLRGSVNTITIHLHFGEWFLNIKEKYAPSKYLYKWNNEIIVGFVIRLLAFKILTGLFAWYWKSKSSYVLFSEIDRIIKSWMRAVWGMKRLKLSQILLLNTSLLWVMMCNQWKLRAVRSIIVWAFLRLQSVQ